MVSILFTQKNSTYKKFNGTDCWDKKRDAKNFDEKNVIIAHPPCRAWATFKGIAKPEPGEKELAILAVDLVRKNGGIVEHPNRSSLWKQMRVPRPNEGSDEFGGFTISIDQYWFGHRGKKNSWLYIVGIKPKNLPPFPIRLGHTPIKVEKMGKYERERTPIELCRWLLDIAKFIKNEKN